MTLPLTLKDDVGLHVSRYAIDRGWSGEEMTDHEAEGLSHSIAIWDDQYAGQEQGKPVGIEYPTEALVIYVSNLRKGRDLSAYFRDEGREHSSKRGYVGDACEIGFGSTANLRLLRDKGFSVVGLEVSGEAVRRGRAQLNAMGIQDISLQEWKPYEIPYPDNHFSLICGMQCIYYNLDMEEMVAEIHRTLLPGGSFIFSFFSDRHTYIQHTESAGWDGQPRIKKWAETLPNKRIRGALFWQPECEKDLLELFQGFNSVRTFTTESSQTPMFESWWYVCGEK